MDMEKLKLRVTIDRPIGFEDDYGNIYPINYGFVLGVIGGDGEILAYRISEHPNTKAIMDAQKKRWIAPMIVLIVVRSILTQDGLTK